MQNIYIWWLNGVIYAYAIIYICDISLSCFYVLFIFNFLTYRLLRTQENGSDIGTSSAVHCSFGEHEDFPAGYEVIVTMKHRPIVQVLTTLVDNGYKIVAMAPAHDSSFLREPICTSIPLLCFSRGLFSRRFKQSCLPPIRDTRRCLEDELDHDGQNAPEQVSAGASERSVSSMSGNSRQTPVPQSDHVPRFARYSWTLERQPHSTTPKFNARDFVIMSSAALWVWTYCGRLWWTGL